MQQNNNPLTWDLYTWLLAVVMASGGGLINCFNLIKTSKTHRISMMAWIGEFFTSGFVGVGVVMAMLSFDYPIGLSVFFGCVAGHYSTRLLFKIEEVIDSKLNQYIDKKEVNDENFNQIDR